MREAWRLRPSGFRLRASRFAFGETLDALRRWAPDNLVDLEVQADGQRVFQDPGDEVFGVELPPDGGGEEGAAEPRQTALGDGGAHPLVVGAVGEDELELV